MESDDSDKAQLLTLQQLIAEEQKGYKEGNLIADNDFISIARQLTVYDPKVHKVRDWTYVGVYYSALHRT